MRISKNLAIHFILWENLSWIMPGLQKRISRIKCDSTLLVNFSSWLQIQRPRVRFPALPDFLRSSGSGTGYNWGATWRNSSGSGLENREYGRGDPLRWPRDILYPQKLTLTSPKSGCSSVGMVRLRTKATEFFFFFCSLIYGNKNEPKRSN
jgi:hypothetical protein